jgi:hypothetical protein
VSAQAGPNGLYTLPVSRLDPFGRVYPAIALGVMIAVLAMWISTQYAARALGYQSSLGKPLLRHVYSPLDAIVWSTRFDHSRFGARVQTIFEYHRFRDGPAIQTINPSVLGLECWYCVSFDE